VAVELYTKTGQNVADEVQQKFGDIGSVQITPAMILSWINNGQRKITDDAPFIEASASTASLAGQAAYDLAALFAASRIQNIQSIYYSGQPLDIIPWQQFQPLVAANALPAATIINGATAGASASIWGSVLTIFPTPQDSTANAITVYFHQYPVELAAIGNALTVPDRYYNALVEYVFAQALLLDENFAAAEQLLTHHEQSLQRQRGRADESPTDFYGGVTMDPEDNDAVY
jgi:hypothetical protein